MIQNLISSKKIENLEAKVSFLDLEKASSWKFNNQYINSNQGIGEVFLKTKTKSINLVKKTIKFSSNNIDNLNQFNIRPSILIEKTLKKEYNSTIDKEILSLMKSLGETYELPEMKYNFIERLFKIIGYKKIRTIKNKNDLNHYIMFCANFLNNKIRNNIDFTIIPNKFIGYFNYNSFESTNPTYPQENYNIRHIGKLANIDIYASNIDKMIIGKKNDGVSTGIIYLYNEPTITINNSDSILEANYKITNIGKSQYLTVDIVEGDYNILSFIRNKIKTFISYIKYRLKN